MVKKKFGLWIEYTSYGLKGRVDVKRILIILWSKLSKNASYDSIFASTKWICRETKLYRYGYSRSILKGKNVPGDCWGEVVRHTIYLLNLLPTKVLPNITSYEAWFDKKPNLEYLKVFGCIVYAKVVGVHLKKLEYRSKKMVYLGVEDGTKGYRLFDPES